MTGSLALSLPYRTALVFVSLILSLPANAELPQYQVKDLGTLGGNFSTAVGISNDGEVVGWSASAGYSEIRAFVYRGDGLVDLGTLGGTFSAAEAISRDGKIVGRSTLPGDEEEHAFLYQDGHMRDLGTLGGPYSAAYDVNDAGQVTGHSTINSDRTNFIWNVFLYANGFMQDVGTLGGSHAVAWAINNRGDVTGSSATRRPSCSPFPPALCDGPDHAFAYVSGSLIDIGTFGGPYSTSYGRDINERGHVVGWAQDENGNARAFLYRDGVLIDLGTLGGSRSLAFAVNNKDEVVGTASLSSESASAFLSRKGTMTNLGTSGMPYSMSTAINQRGEVAGDVYGVGSHAFVWRTGKMIDLGTLGGARSNAKAINDRGQVTGDSETADGSIHAFLATPVTLLFERLIQLADRSGFDGAIADLLIDALERFEADDGPGVCHLLTQVTSLPAFHDPYSAIGATLQQIASGSEEIRIAISCK